MMKGIVAACLSYKFPFSIKKYEKHLEIVKYLSLSLGQKLKYFTFEFDNETTTHRNTGLMAYYLGSGHNPMGKMTSEEKIRTKKVKSCFSPELFYHTRTYKLHLIN